MGKALEGLPLVEEDKASFLGLFCREGTEEGMLQQGILEQGRDRLGRIISELEQEKAQKCRMMLGLGALGGLLLLIVLL